MSNEDQQTTLRETLEAAVAEHSEPVEVVSQPVESTEQNRVRDEGGKFAKQEAKAIQPELNLEEPVITTPEFKEIPRPSSWKKELWPVWDKMNKGEALTPQEARQVAEYNATREQQFATGVSTYKQEADRARPLLDAIQPFQADIERYGVNASELVHNLLSSHKTLSTGSNQEKLQLMGYLAQSYKIPLEALYDPQVQQQFLNTPYQAQPQPAAPAPDIHKLVESALTQREAVQTITAMERDVEKYPFFQYVRPNMAQLLETGAATDLDKAYEMALQAPEHSRLTSIMQSQQNQAEEHRKIEVQKKVVQAARANNVSVKSATPMSTGATNSKPSVRESLMEAVEAHRTGAKV